MRKENISQTQSPQSAVKVMKCPECEEVTTFTHHWKETTFYFAPVIIGNDDIVLIDHDKGNKKYSGVDNMSDDEGECDKCGCVLCLEEIEIVEVKKV
jgi:hypothetical protein